MLLMDVNVVRNSKDKTGVCTKTTLSRDCCRNSSPLLWVFAVNDPFDNICIKKEKSLVSGAFLQKHPKIIIGTPSCHECSVVFKGLCVCNSIVVYLQNKRRMSPRLLMCFLHTSFCYGGGYFWVKGLGAARWVNNVTVYFTANIQMAWAFSLKPCQILGFCFTYLFIFGASLQLVFLEHTK